jgi:ABC-type nitrate/sulfonate/bicarbonate transport system substrate-binding protein
LVYAHESGIFARYDLDVELVRSTHWASIRDNVIHGHLDAAHAPATLPFLAQLGVESEPCPCVSGLVISLQGNAITLSRNLWDRGITSAERLKEEIFKAWGRRSCTFAVVSPYSCQHLLLWKWLTAAGISPGAHVRIVTVPPEQMFPMLKIGYLDGFCVGEPWTSMAAASDVGACVATGADLAPLHPEKVLMVRRTFSEGRSEEHERLIAAVIEACAFCDRPQNRKLLAEMLAHAHYINAPAECLTNAFSGAMAASPSMDGRLLDFSIFHAQNANRPDAAKAHWITENLRELTSTSTFPRLPRGFSWHMGDIFRPDIYERARMRVSQQAARLTVDAQLYETR